MIQWYYCRRNMSKKVIGANTGKRKSHKSKFLGSDDNAT